MLSRNRFVLALAGAVLGLLTACGYVGDPLPPALKIPVAVDDLVVTERGSSLIIQFSLSGMTLDGIALEEYGAVDLRIGAGGVQPFHQPSWEAGAQPVGVDPPPGLGQVEVEIPADPWVGREVIAGVRTSNPKGRWSGWSNLYALHIVEPVASPANVSAENVIEGVRVIWTAKEPERAPRYRVFRKTEEGEAYSMLGESETSNWLDTNTVYDSSYEYRVQALVTAGAHMAESELSEPAAITPVDEFPPPAPLGLRAVAGLNSIELAWDRGPAEDVDSYRIYRSTDGDPAQRIAGEVTAGNYSDRDIVPGRSYRYAVSAVDRLGNESPPSEEVERTAP